MTPVLVPLDPASGAQDQGSDGVPELDVMNSPWAGILSSEGMSRAAVAAAPGAMSLLGAAGGAGVRQQRD